jgi:hypothetical protein
MAKDLCMFQEILNVTACTCSAQSALSKAFFLSSHGMLLSDQGQI